MRAISLSIPEIILIEPKVFHDERGYFFESFNEKDFSRLTGITANFVQDNHSRSSQGVLRGLHYQIHNPQGKLIRVTAGEVFDVAVDIRLSSPTFGKWVSAHLSAENKNQLWLPEGFAHGFFALSEYTELQYKTTAFYEPENEYCIAWNDPELAITWPENFLPTLSERDARGLPFYSAPHFK